MSDAQESGLWYFAYGSNLHSSIFVERREMRPLATRWGWLDGYRLCFNIPIGPGERGVANIEPDIGARVCGALYLLTHADFDRLDRTEGVHVELYRRLPVEVVTDIHGAINAVAYRSLITTTGRKPSPRYMRLLLDGAREHGLPDEWVSVLQRFELAVDEREDQSI
jgi:gamma-glutamylcyclotransferase